MASNDTFSHRIPNNTAFKSKIGTGLFKSHSSTPFVGCQFSCGRSRTNSNRLPWESGIKYGGWGGHEYFEMNPGLDRNPVIFVHGLNRDACDWYDMAQYLLDTEFNGDELWGITFNSPAPSHSEMAYQLDDFIKNVKDETGCNECTVIAHSLGVTGVRFWLSEYSRYDWIDTFIGLAGANHGIEYARISSKYEFGIDNPIFQFLRSDYDDIPNHPLKELNDDETPGNIDYYTLRGDLDALFLGKNSTSPILEGATNEALPVTHDGVREHSRAKQQIYKWLS